MQNPSTFKQQLSSTYVDLMSDPGFKIVYGDRANKKLLIDLLNAVLPEEAEVDDIIEYRDREQLKDTVYSKGSRMDLLCRGKDGRNYIVEVQRERCDPFFKRVMYYASGVYRNNLSEGDDYDQLTPVYVVGILNFSLGHRDEDRWDTDNFISHYEMVEKRTGEFASTVFSCNFAELSLFTKSVEECTSYRDLLFYWFKHSGKLDMLPEEVRRSPKLCELAKACEKGSFTPEKKLEYESLMMNELDKINMIRQAERRALARGQEKGEKLGLKKGRAEGLEKGRASRNIEIARNMLAEGIEDSMIARFTGLTSAQINGLRQKN